MTGYIYTTDVPNFVVVALGEDENESQTVAEQALSTRPNTKLQGRQAFNHSIVISLDVTILNKASSDDVLIRKILAAFGEGSPIELRNDPHPDGTVTKRFFVEGVGRLDLQLKNPEQVADYEKNGLNDSYIAELIKGLKPFVKRAVRPELAPVLSTIESPQPNGTTPSES